MHRLNNFRSVPSSVPSLFCRTYRSYMRKSRTLEGSQTYFDVSKSLTVKDKPLPSLHRIVHVEVLHAQDFLVDVERMQVPVESTSGCRRKALNERNTNQIIEPNASMAHLWGSSRRIDSGTALLRP